MRFAIMSRLLAYQNSGLNTLLDGLFRGIQQIESSHEFLLLFEPGQSIPKWLQEQFRVVTIQPRTQNPISRFGWDHLAVGKICKKLGVDALYAPAHVKPIYTPCPVVVCVLDMIYHLYPQFWNWSDQTYFRFMVSNFTPRATRIAALSESTKADLLALTNISEDIIEVIYPGVPDGFGVLHKDESRMIRDKLNLKNPFVLFYGGFHIRKGLPNLINAFEIIADNVPHDLVILVSTQWQNSELISNIHNSLVNHRIRLIKGDLPRTDLNQFLNEADLFVFPSLYEGFGFPVLEALACGCPTITTDISSLPEVTGEAALLVPPDNPQALGEGMEQVLTDNDLQSTLRKRALTQAKKFSWKNTAEQTIRLLEEAART